MTTNTEQDFQTPWHKWRGLGWWNYYFLLKFALLWHGYLNFHPFANLIFLAFLLFPLSSTRLHRYRNILATFIGLGLFYYDTWLPNIYSVLAQGKYLFDFSSPYLLELLNRFIDWKLIGAAFVLLVAYLFIAQWLRITVLTITVLAWLNIAAMQTPPTALSSAQPKSANTRQPLMNSANSQVTLNADLPPTAVNLTNYLKEFYQHEKTRRTLFPHALTADAQPFDILIIQICSLSWSDLKIANLQQHPLWKKFDILFSHFNSAASYRGPAAIRLLRASCGQPAHDDLYAPVAPDCYLMNNLANLGFSPRLMLDHTGQFGNFLQELRQYGDLAQAPLLSQTGIKSELTAFNGSPIYNDAELLNRWLAQIIQARNPRNVTFFNTVVLHDGNRYIGQYKSAPYQPRGQKFFDQLDHFFDQLQKSGRKVLVIVIPEHGANLDGDKLQMPGLRDIPSPNIIHIPVGIKLIGLKTPPANNPLIVDSPSSYLAISDLIARLVDGKIFNESTINWPALVQNLPQTSPVAENAGVTVMQYHGKYYLRLKGETAWLPYPQ